MECQKCGTSRRTRFTANRAACFFGKSARSPMHQPFGARSCRQRNRNGQESATVRSSSPPSSKAPWSLTGYAGLSHRDPQCPRPMTPNACRKGRAPFTEPDRHGPQRHHNGQEQLGTTHWRLHQPNKTLTIAGTLRCRSAKPAARCQMPAPFAPCWSPRFSGSRTRCHCR